MIAWQLNLVTMNKSIKMTTTAPDMSFTTVPTFSKEPEQFKPFGKAVFTTTHDSRLYKNFSSSNSIALHAMRYVAAHAIYSSFEVNGTFTVGDKEYQYSQRQHRHFFMDGETQIYRGGNFEEGLSKCLESGGDLSFSPFTCVAKNIRIYPTFTSVGSSTDNKSKDTVSVPEPIEESDDTKEPIVVIPGLIDDAW
jgi:hypothetical protein